MAKKPIIQIPYASTLALTTAANTFNLQQTFNGGFSSASANVSGDVTLGTTGSNALTINSLTIFNDFVGMGAAHGGITNRLRITGSSQWNSGIRFSQTGTNAAEWNCGLFGDDSTFYIGVEAAGFYPIKLNADGSLDMAKDLVTVSAGGAITAQFLNSLGSATVGDTSANANRTLSVVVQDSTLGEAELRLGDSTNPVKYRHILFPANYTGTEAGKLISYFSGTAFDTFDGTTRTFGANLLTSKKITIDSSETYGIVIEMGTNTVGFDGWAGSFCGGAGYAGLAASAYTNTQYIQGWYDNSSGSAVEVGSWKVGTGFQCNSAAAFTGNLTIGTTVSDTLTVNAKVGWIKVSDGTGFISANAGNTSLVYIAGGSATALSEGARIEVCGASYVTNPGRILMYAATGATGYAKIQLTDDTWVASKLSVSEQTNTGTGIATLNLIGTGTGAASKPYMSFFDSSYDGSTTAGYLGGVGFGDGSASIGHLLITNNLTDSADAGRIRLLDTVELIEQGSSPAASNTGYGAMYAKTDGILYYRAHDGSERALTESITAKEFTTVVQTLSSSAGAVTWNTASGQMATLTLTENVTGFTISNLDPGQTAQLRIVQDTVARTVAWTTTVKWPGGTAPTISTGSGAVDIITFTNIGSVIYGVFSQNMS